MARQLNLLATGQIIPTALHQEMERSYLEYAMSVIVGRALPDVRDGLKPVHRRILYAMHELGLTPDRPYRKCARVVGDVLGKYHPHGDQAVYDALTRMVQDFSSRYPLLSGHGNFGSVDNDPPAAMRYTETRLAAIAQEAALGNISEAIVDFSNNFDNSQQEPVVLPAQLPILLLNGCAGIAVGMATNIPPHNLGEIVDGLIALIDHPELTDEQLWTIIPGPDFPTGGEIIDPQGIREAYQTGRGIIPVRGVVKIEKISLEGRRPKERTAIVVTELPYQVNKSSWVEKVAELVNQGRLEGISDLRDESDRHGIRVVVELKKEAVPETVLEDLYKHTALQSNFGVIILALVNNKPCQLSLKQALEEFLQFREDTLKRQYNHELKQAENRLHLLEGLLIALNHLEQTINILKNAPDGTTAKLIFQEQMGLSDAQSDSLLAMPMRRLTGLERQKLQKEYEELQKRIQELNILLNSRHELMKSLKKELRILKRKFADQRRTRIVKTNANQTVTINNNQSKYNQSKTKENAENQNNKIGQKAPKTEATSKHKEKEYLSTTSKNNHEQQKIETESLTLFTPQIPPIDAILTITNRGQIYWQSQNNQPQSYRKSSDEFPIYQEIIGDRDTLMIVTNQGRIYPITVSEIPPENSQNISWLSFFPKSVQREEEKLIGIFFMPEEKTRNNLILVTEQAKIKRVSVTELTGIGNRGLSLIKLKEQDKLSYICLREEGEEIALATTGGRVLRWKLTDEQLPLMGRNSQGNQALRLRYGEALAGCVPLKNEQNLLLVTELGYGKRLALKSLPLKKLGDIGTHLIQFTSKEDNLAAMIGTLPKGNIILVTNQGRRASISLESINIWEKDGSGDSLIKLKSGEIIEKVVYSRH